MILRLSTLALRAILTLSLAVGMGFGFAAIAQTTTPQLSKRQAGYYRVKVGAAEVIALSDGSIILPALNLLTNAQPGEVERLLTYAYRNPQVETSVNAYLIVSESNLVLVDTGGGDLLGPTANKLSAGLAAAGYKPEQITDILITHSHGDHVGGLTDGTGMVFPNATIRVESRELAFWTAPGNGAGAKVRPYLEAGKVKTFDGNAQLLPGISAMATPGHTPGHSFYVLESQGEKIVFWGDLMHVAEVQFPNPSITIAFDSDSRSAAAQRRKAYLEAASIGYLVASTHVSFPGIGRLRPSGSGYQWFPIPYVNDATNR